MNFRKAKVSKAGWLVLVPMLGLLGAAPAPPPQPSLTPEPAAMAYAVPQAGRDAGQARARGSCANARRELRFEMLAVTEPYPPPRRSPVVCLAVYRPSDRP